MFPFSPFARPVGSFQVPVQPPTPVGGSCSKLTATFPSEWLPYILGSLTQLTLQATWQGDQEQIEAAQMQAANIIGQIQQSVCLVPSENDGGISCGDDMCCLRWQNGVLQMFSCGEWTDVPGMDPGQGGGQPGGGSPQPPAGGGTQEYCFTLAGSGKARLPTNVSSGDTILLSDLLGAWHDDRDLFWYCPDGWLFISGSCYQNVPHGSPDPVPTELHYAIIAEIAGTFYNVLNLDSSGQPQVFTVPGGITNEPVTFQANTDSLPDGAGVVQFCAQVTNNLATEWTQVFDFTAGPFPAAWTIEDDSGVGYSPNHDGVWVAGVGYQSNRISSSSTSFNLIRLTSAIPATITHAEFYFDPSSVDYHGMTGNDTFLFQADATLLLHFSQPNMATSPQIWDGTKSFSSLYLNLLVGSEVCVCDPGGMVTLSKIVFRGTGINPY